VNLGGRLQRLDSFLTFDGAQTGLRLHRFGVSGFRLRLFGGFVFGLSLWHCRFVFCGFVGFVFGGHLVGDSLGLIGGFDRRFVNLGGGLQRLDSLFTLDRAQTHAGPFGFFLAFRGELLGFFNSFGRHPRHVGAKCFGVRSLRFFGFLGLVFVVLVGRLGVLVLGVTRSLGSGDDTGRCGHCGQLLGECLDRVFFVLDLLRLAGKGAGSSRPLGATMMYTTAPMNTNVDVNELIRMPAMCVAMSLRISSTQNRPTQ
jgi:hypothetical protein